LALCLVSVPATSQEATCEGVRCSEHGTCFEENGSLHCLCDAGYAELALTCVPSDTEEQVRRSRRNPDAIGQVMEIALAEVGHERWQVGRGVEGFPGPLTDYLEPFEWWCGDFVSWVYAAAGVPLSGGSNGGWLITDNRAIAAWHEQRGLWYDHDHPEWDTFEPRPGDFIRFFTARYGHAAIVAEVTGTTVWVVEGNVEGAVERTPYYHFRRNRLIDGFGRMALEDEMPTADAGADFVAVVATPLTLRAVATDDGPEDALRVSWSGPESALFEDAASLSSSVRFAEPGHFELELRVYDREDEYVADWVHVSVLEPAPPPTVDRSPAGADRVDAAADLDEAEQDRADRATNEEAPLHRWIALAVAVGVALLVGGLFLRRKR